MNIKEFKLFCIKNNIQYAFFHKFNTDFIAIRWYCGNEEFGRDMAFAKDAPMEIVLEEIIHAYRLQKQSAVERLTDELDEVIRYIN